MLILGISAYYHDSAAALIEDGRVVSAAQEERFTRKNMMHVILKMLLITVLMRGITNLLI